LEARALGKQGRKKDGFLIGGGQDHTQLGERNAEEKGGGGMKNARGFPQRDKVQQKKGGRSHREKKGKKG